MSKELQVKSLVKETALSMEGLRLEETESENGIGRIIIYLNDVPLLTRDYDESGLPKHYRKGAEPSYEKILSLVFHLGIVFLKKDVEKFNLINT